MRILLLLSLIALLCGNSLAQEQDSRLPRCSSAQLAAASDMRKDFDPVLFSGANIESLDDLLNFGAAHIAWRDDMWEQLPLCDEVFSMGLALDQVSEAIFMNLTLRSAGVANEENPYYERGLDSGREMARLGTILSAASVDAVGAAATVDTARACTGVERQIVAGDIWLALVNLLNKAFAVDSFESLLDLIKAKMAWREAIWAQLPPCAEAYEIATWMYRYSSDLTKIFMLDLYGVERARNPYDGSYIDGIIQYSSYSQWVETADIDYTSLPLCANTPINERLYDSLKGHYDWAEAPRDTAEDLAKFTGAHVEWRDSLRRALPYLPGCREAFEITLLALQITGDAATASALAESGIGRDELTAAYEQRIVVAGERIGELIPLLQPASNSGKAKPALAQCSDSELDLLFDDLQGFLALREQALETRRHDDLIAYIQKLFEWRDMLWNALPACAEVFDIAALMIQMTGDYAALLALDFAGVPQDDNPYLTELDRGLESFEQWQADVWARIEGPVVTPGPTSTYYVDANGFAVLRSCASRDCENVGIVADGEALNVVDDSGDWFEVYIGAGAVGYIQREMMSSKRAKTE